MMFVLTLWKLWRRKTRKLLLTAYCRFWVSETNRQRALYHLSIRPIDLHAVDDTRLITVTAYLPASCRIASASANNVMKCTKASYTHRHAQNTPSALIKLNKSKIKDWIRVLHSGPDWREWVNTRQPLIFRKHAEGDSKIKICFQLACHMPQNCNKIVDKIFSE